MGLGTPGPPKWRTVVQGFLRVNKGKWARDPDIPTILSILFVADLWTLPGGDTGPGPLGPRSLSEIHLILPRPPSQGICRFFLGYQRRKHRSHHYIIKLEQNLKHSPSITMSKQKISDDMLRSRKMTLFILFTNGTLMDCPTVRSIPCA